MMQRVLHRMLLWLAVLLPAACTTVHEFPIEAPEVPDIEVTLDIETSIGDITIVEDTADHSFSVYPQVFGSDYELRLVAEVYNSSNQLVTRVIHPLYTQNDTMSQSITLNLPPKQYYVMLWREYIRKSNPQQAMYYLTDNGLRSVTMLNANVGDRDEMDCCFGKAALELGRYVGQRDVHITIPVTLKRPVAKYILITNDIDRHTEKLLRTVANVDDAVYAQTRAIINRYACKVIYQGNTLYGFDCYTGKPNDAKAGMFFDAQVELINDHEARIAFSYPFAFIEGDIIHAGLQIFDEAGNKIQEVPDVTIPVVQGKLTVIKSDFLTHEYPQGIVINQDFDGQFDITLPD